MKLSIVVLALCVVLAQSHIQSQNFRHFTEKSDLSEEQKSHVTEALVHGYKLVEHIHAFYDELVNIRKTVPKSESETIQVLDMFNKSLTARACTACTDFFNAALKTMDKKIFLDIAEKIAVRVCSRKLNITVCQQAIQSFGQIVWQAAMDRTLNSTYVCATIAMCPRTYQDQKLLQYVNEIMKDKPATSYPTPTKKSTYTVLQMTDPHIDLQYLAGSNTQCSEPLCCRAESGAPADGQPGAQYWGTVGNCDIPMRTFDQFLMFTAATFKIDMILWMGDNIAHDIWHQTQDTQEDNTYDATQKIMQYFPNATVYPMFGNHEPFPADQFDFSSNSSAWMTSELADMWKQWLDDNAYNVFKNFSYYSMVNPKYNLKVIALDTLTCDSSDFYLLKNPTDPFNQLEWLRNELYDAENRTLSVFIVGHIPPGDYGCDSEWSSRYRALIDRFTNIIRGQFYGHTHDDQFQVVRSYTDDSAVGLVFIAPSLTTYSNLLPSFRIYEVDAETNQPINYYQYRLDLNKWNSNITGPIEWDLAYDATDLYNLTDLSFASFDELADQLLTNVTLANTYASNQRAGNEVSNMAARDLQHVYCGVKNSVSEDAFDCLGLDANMGDIMAMAKQALPGQWAYDKC